MKRTKPEYILSVSTGHSVERSEHASLDALDAAFWEAVRDTPLAVQPVPWNSTEGQISAETFNVEGFGHAKTHAYRLVDGRIFHRPLEAWHTSDMLAIFYAAPPLPTVVSLGI